jgi:hypothetical protein
MTLQNRATPTGEVVAESGRGLVFGNRGCLHDDAGRIRRRFAGKRWIACSLEFRGRYRGPQMLPGRYTPLFFLDEATSLAAGHRPCAECRHEDHVRFTSNWGRVHGGPTGADAIDARLHAERVDPSTRAQRRHRLLLDELPDGVFVLHERSPHLVLGSRLLRWTPSGYEAGRRRPEGATAIVLTPPSLIGMLRVGWESSVPLLHPSASGSDGGQARAHPVPDRPLGSTSARRSR